jgi:hypothetical protein
MTAEVKAGVVVLAAVVVATIAWLALHPVPRHDGLTRVQAERFARGGIAPECIRRLRCRAVEAHWQCTIALVGGQTFRTTTDPHGDAAAFAFFCGS